MILNTTNKILLVILIGLAGVVGFPWLKSYIVKEDRPSAPFDFAEFSADKVTDISIRSNDKETHLVRENDVWKIDGEEADKEVVNEFFDRLSQVKVESLAGTNPKNHKNFGVTTEDGIHLNIQEGDEENSFIIGSSGSAPNSLYMRKSDGDDVYLVSGQVRKYLTQGADGWKKKEQKVEETHSEGQE